MNSTDRIDIVASPTSAHQMDHARALQKGLSVFGIESLICPGLAHASAKTVSTWGWRSGKKFRDLGREVLVLERGYLGDRFAWTSVALNGLNGRGGFAATPDDAGERFNKYHSHLLKPWNAEGEHVLLVGQVDGDAALQGKNLQPWYEEMAGKLNKAGHKVVFRQHPEEYKKRIKRKVANAVTSTSSLADDLDQSYLVVTYNSNTAVDAMLAGKPIIVSDAGSMAGPVAGSPDKANSITHYMTSEPENRRSWLNALAWCQWTMEEIENGDALRGLLLPSRL